MDDTTAGRAVPQDPSATFLTPKELQHELRIGPATCYRLLKRGAIPSVRVGTSIWIPRTQLEEALGIHSNLGKEA